eukprot:s245_g14.t1
MKIRDVRGAGCIVRLKTWHRTSRRKIRFSIFWRRSCAQRLNPLLPGRFLPGPKFENGVCQSFLKAETEILVEHRALSLLGLAQRQKRKDIKRSKDCGPTANRPRLVAGMTDDLLGPMNVAKLLQRKGFC